MSERMRSPFSIVANGVFVYSKNFFDNGTFQQYEQIT